MTYEQFWEQDCQLVRYYRKASQIRQETKNQDAWLQGAYFYEALCDAAPIFRAFAKKGTKPVPYRKEPFPISAEKDEKRRQEKEQRNDDQAKAYMEAFAIAINKKFEQKGGEGNGR